VVILGGLEPSDAGSIPALGILLMVGADPVRHGDPNRQHTK
jgi:hypothetical protein